MDGIENEELRDPKKCYQYIKGAMKDDQNYYLFLVEVQFMPRFEEVLNSLLRISNVDVYAINHEEKKRVRKQLEVDFVVNQGSQRYYIQVAYDMTTEEKQTQEFNSFRNIPDSFKKIVIVNGTKKPWRNEEGFVFMGMK